MPYPPHTAEAVAARRAELIALAAEKPAHAAHLTRLLACATDDEAGEVPTPPRGQGVTEAAADALYADAAWLLNPRPHVAWPGDYRTYRRAADRFAARMTAGRDRAARRGPESVASLLRLAVGPRRT